MTTPFSILWGGGQGSPGEYANLCCVCNLWLSLFTLWLCGPQQPVDLFARDAVAAGGEPDGSQVAQSDPAVDRGLSDREQPGSFGSGDEFARHGGWNVTHPFGIKSITGRGCKHSKS